MLQTQDELKIEYVKITDLRSAEYNPRKSSDKERDDLKKSIESFGLVDPIIVNSYEPRKNIIIGGHFRCRVAKELGYKTVPVTYVEIVDIEKEKELNLRLNKNLGEFDMDLLSEFDDTLLKDVGFDSAELDMIFPTVPDEKDDEVPDVPEEPISKMGDIYQLGNHRVMCGDSTKVDDVEKLMDGKNADLIVTDPPYGVGYVGKTKDSLTIQNDISIEASQKVWSKVFRNYYKFSKDGSSYYSFSCQGGDQMMMMMTIDENWLVKHELMWVKNNFVFSRCDYKYKHEPIIYGWKKDMTHQFYGDAKQSSVLEYDKPSRSESHPTIKPVDLLAHLIKNSSKMGDIIIDLFLGSGSTLIACEKTNRICYGLELDCRYVDVIIKRWEDYTGRKSVKID